MKLKSVIITLFLLFFPLILEAQIPEKYQGWCEQGGQRVQVQGQTSSTFVQRSYPVCTITVFLTGTTTPAVIYSDVNMTPLANPFTNQNINTGQFFFFVAVGHYDIQIAASGLATYTLNYVNVGTSSGGGGGGGANLCTTGGDLSQKITNVYATLPNASSNIIDCTNLNGGQSLSIDPFTSMILNVTILLPTGVIVPTITLNIPGNVTLNFPSGAILNSTLPINVTGTLQADASQQIFSGTGFVSILGHNIVAYPQWFGAVGDDVNDDTAAIQATINACRGAVGGGLGGTAYQATCKVVIPDDTYRTTAQLNMYANLPYIGASLEGESPSKTTIDYHGPNNQSALRMIGQQQQLRNIQIVAGSDWLDGITYDGQSTIGISTNGIIEAVTVQCQGHNGNGMSTGRGAYQADQATITKLRIIGCLSGYGFVSMDPNAVSNVLYNPALNLNWIGVGSTASSANVSVLGGEFDGNDVNFVVAAGTTLTVSGVRTEGSKMQYVQAVGSYVSTTTFNGYVCNSTWWSEHSGQPRPATNATNTDATHITLSVANSVTWGDYITIAGAGAAGGLLHTHIASMTDPTHAVLDTASIVTNVANAPTNLDTSVENHQLEFLAAGPYVVQASYFGSPQAENAIVPSTTGTITLSGVMFVENFTYSNPLNVNPFNYHTQGWPAGISWIGTMFNSNTRMIDHLNTSSPPTVYFFDNSAGGSLDNAWVLNTSAANYEPIVNGMKLIVTARTHTLRSGNTNTLNYNCHGTDFVWPATIVGNLTSPVAVNATVEFVWDGSGAWRLIGQ